MEINPPDKDRIKGALYGMFIADALAMPVHWYYDREALKRDYGRVTGYLKPENPHPDSILWRSSYSPQNQTADILHDQARFRIGNDDENFQIHLSVSSMGEAAREKSARQKD